jgi:anthranilate synthase component 2
VRVLIIDNYDSFVYNIAQAVGSLGGEPIVRRNDELSLKQAKSLHAERIIISPGPGRPDEIKYFGVCRDILLKLSPSVPTLGICLGNQGIGQVFGGRISRASTIMHGKTSRIVHDGRGVLQDVKNPLTATRYHSLVIEKKSLPDSLKVTALSLEDAEIMGVRHRDYPIEGVQFHPESIMTPEGPKILRNFLEKGVQA